MNQNHYIQMEEKFGAHNYKPLDVVLSRGEGVWVWDVNGMEFHPEVGGARQYCEQLKEKGLLCKETHDHIIRFAPPLVITQKEVDWALERIESVMAI